DHVMRLKTADAALARSQIDHQLQSPVWENGLAVCAACPPVVAPHHLDARRQEFGRSPGNKHSVLYLNTGVSPKQGQGTGTSAGSWRSAGRRVDFAMPLDILCTESCQHSRIRFYLLPIKDIGPDG